MRDFWDDIRYAARTLMRTPTVSLVAIVSLALGIGATVALFGVMHALLRPLPIRDAARLVALSTSLPTAPDQKGPFSLAMFDSLRRQSGVFSHLVAWSGRSDALRNLEANGTRSLGTMTEVTGDYLSALGARPLLGRLIGPQDVGLFAGASAPVAVLDYRSWQRMYGRNPHVLGQTIRVDGFPLTIVGVTTKEFGGMDADHAPDVVAPLGYDGEYNFRRPQLLALNLAGQLAPGITLERARTQLTALWPHILEAAAPPGMLPDRRARFFSRGIAMESLASGSSYLRQQFLKPLAVLMGLVGFVLLIACMNLANLLLARAAGRRHELGVRAALGSSRWRLLRPLLLESLLIMLSGALLGFPLAFRAGPFLLRTVHMGWLPITLDPTPDLRVTLFAFAIAILAGTLAGLAPAWGVLRTDPAGSLRRQARTVHGARGRLGKLLIAGQAALAVVLVAGAVLFARTLQNLRPPDPGFARGNILTLLLFPQVAHSKIPNPAAYYRELADSLMRLPGVRSVSYSNSAPVAAFDWKDPVSRSSSPGSPVNASRDLVGPEFFRTMGIHPISGREFDWSDNQSSPPTAIISDKLARSLFPGQDPIGRAIDIGGSEAPVRGAQIIGVVPDASLGLPRSPHPAAVYTLFLKDPDADDFNLDILAAGVRIALGAGRFDIVAMVLRQASFVVGCGLAAGVVLSAAGARLAAALLFEVAGTDPLIIGAAAAILLLVASLAASVPAIRAARTDPMEALRCE